MTVQLDLFEPRAQATCVAADASDYGMVEVSRDVFFETVGQLDVHPSSAGFAWDDILGYPSRWNLRDGTVVGMTIGLPPRSRETFMVTPSFFETHVKLKAKGT